MMKPYKHALATCSQGNLGLILSDEPELVTYPDGTSGLAYTGIHLSEGRVGQLWSSRNPKVLPPIRPGEDKESLETMKFIGMTSERLLTGYLECAIWVEEESLMEGADELGIKDFNFVVDEDTLFKMRADCHKFNCACYELIGSNYVQAGHDLWLSRNGHGTGFWDREEIYGKEGARILQYAARVLGKFDLYVGDDGLIHGA